MTCPLHRTRFSPEELAERSRSFTRYDPGVETEAEYWALMGAFQDDLAAFHSDAFGGHWIFTRYEDCRQILKDDDAFSSQRFQIPQWEIPGAEGGILPESADAPAHGIYRSPLNDALGPVRMRKLTPQARQLATEALAPFVANGGGDLVGEFCVPFPVTMFLLLLGAPLGDAPRLLAWKHQLMTDGLSPDPDRRRRVTDHVLPEVMSYFDGMIAERRAVDEPPADLLTALATARFGDRLWTTDELHRTYVQYLAAGLDTVTNALSMMLEFLLSHPPARAQLIAEPDLIPSAVEELLRFRGIASPARLVVKPVDVGGVALRPGDMVQTIGPATGRDRREFPEPDAVDFRRNPNRHLAFGAGRHRCQGSHLARMELAVGLEAFLAQLPEAALAEGSTPVRRFGAIHGYDRLEIVCPGGPSTSSSTRRES